MVQFMSRNFLNTITKKKPKEDHLNTIQLKGPIYMTDDYKHHFAAIQEHVNTLKTLKGPVYDVESKSHYLEIIKHVESMKDLKGPIYQVGEPGHKFTGSSMFTPEAADLKTLAGPKYNLDADHQFSEIMERVDKLKELQGPVYTTEGAHQFKEIKRHVESLRLLAGPIYQDERHGFGEQTMASYGMDGVKTVHRPIYVKEFSKHNYSEEPKPAHLKQVLLATPVYFSEEQRHHFDQIKTQAETLKGLLGPIYDVAHKHSCSMVSQKPDLEKTLQGPIYFENMGNKFDGSNYAAADKGKDLAGPIYRLDNPRYCFDVIMEHADILRGLQGPVYDVDVHQHYRVIKERIKGVQNLLGPIYDLQETKHHYGEMVSNVETLKNLSGPVYNVDHKNNS